jgi:hypothetical protein
LLVAETLQGRSNGPAVVRDNCLLGDLKRFIAEHILYGLSACIRSLALGATVADGQYRRPNHR